MKATGVLRKVDDLGRVAIPKVFRHNMHIHEGDTLEIFLGEDSVTFKKYDITTSSKAAIQKAIEFIKEDDDLDTTVKQEVLGKLKDALRSFEQK